MYNTYIFMVVIRYYTILPYWSNNTSYLTRYSCNSFKEFKLISKSNVIFKLFCKGLSKRSFYFYFLTTLLRTDFKNSHIMTSSHYYYLSRRLCIFFYGKPYFNFLEPIHTIIRKGIARRE